MTFIVTAEIQENYNRILKQDGFEAAEEYMRNSQNNACLRAAQTSEVAVNTGMSAQVYETRLPDMHGE